jgi:hypothetical protein
VVVVMVVVVMVVAVAVVMVVVELWMWQIFLFHKNEISWIAAQLQVSQGSNLFHSVTYIVTYSVGWEVSNGMLSFRENLNFKLLPL